MNLKIMKIDFNFMGEYLLVALATFITFITPLFGFIIIISLAVATDTIYAIYSKVRKNGWNIFSSAQLFNIVPKTFFYMATIIFAYLIDVHIIADNHIYNIPLLITKLITVVWTYIEVKSIDERRVKNGKKSIYVHIKELVAKFKDVKKDLKGVEDEV